MKIMMRDGRVLIGTGKQIVQEMQARAWGQDGKSIPEYLEWCVDRALELEQVAVRVQGETDEELCASFIEAMCEVGLARRV